MSAFFSMLASLLLTTGIGTRPVIYSTLRQQEDGRMKEEWFVKNAGACDLVIQSAQVTVEGEMDESGESISSIGMTSYGGAACSPEGSGLLIHGMTLCPGHARRVETLLHQGGKKKAAETKVRFTLTLCGHLGFRTEQELPVERIFLDD